MGSNFSGILILVTPGTFKRITFNLPRTSMRRSSSLKTNSVKKEEVFKGLLELDRDVTIYLEEKTKTPLLISSTVPFGFVRPRITVTLNKWETVPGFEPRPVTEEELKELSEKK